MDVTVISAYTIVVVGKGKSNSPEQKGGRVVNKELFKLLTNILRDIDRIKSYLIQTITTRNEGINLQATERIIKRLESIAQEADNELIDTLIRIEKNFDIEQAKYRISKAESQVRNQPKD
ncbi:hypothetical protein [Peribacillus glennii]|nr:hypothetical protein [Peribacillus glennii]